MFKLDGDMITITRVINIEDIKELIQSLEKVKTNHPHVCYSQMSNATFDVRRFEVRNAAILVTDRTNYPNVGDSDRFVFQLPDSNIVIILNEREDYSFSIKYINVVILGLNLLNRTIGIHR